MWNKNLVNFHSANRWTGNHPVCRHKLLNISPGPSLRMYRKWAKDKYTTVITLESNPENRKKINKSSKKIRTTATWNLSDILSVYLICFSFFPHPFPPETSAQGRDSKSRKVESNKGTASELRCFLSDSGWASWIFFLKTSRRLKGSYIYI